MLNYLELLEDVILHGEVKGDRTGTGTRSVFGRQLRFDMGRYGFPLVTTKKVHFKSVVHELLWMISGDSNVRYLNDNGVTIWDEWADDGGNLGPVYGVQWRKWRDRYTSGEEDVTDYHDQLQMAIDEIKNNPNSRRIIVNSWNVADLPAMKLPPCPTMFQFDVTNGRLSCNVTIRSSDIFLGLPFDIAVYALLTHLVAHVTHLEVGDLVVSTGDTHLYHNHLQQALLQIKRQPRSGHCIRLWNADTITSIDDFKYENIKLELYDPWPAIKAEVSV